MTKQVEITNRDGHILRGIVNIPEDGTRFPAIVNVHGFTGNKSGYKSIYTHTARFLAEHGFASVRFDLYGNGESDGEFEDMTFTGILHDIEDIINWTKTQDFANPDKIKNKHLETDHDILRSGKEEIEIMEKTLQSENLSKLNG